MASSFLQSASSTANATSYTFTDQSTGSAAADRYILVGVGARKAGAAGANPTVTVEGVSAPEVIARWQTVTNSTFTGMFLAPLATGTDADIVVDFGASTMVRAAIFMWRLDDLASATASDTDSDVSNDPTDSIDVPNPGCGVACATTGASTTLAWTGLTESGAEVQVESAMTMGGASDDFASGSSGLSVLANFGSPVESSGVFATWEFGAAPPAGNPWNYYNQQRAGM